MSAPTCRYCGRPIAKRPSSVYLRDKAQAARGVGGSDWLTVDTLPRTIDEAQRLLNWRITRVQRLSPGQSDPGGIFQADGWDGESYAPRYGYFCKVDCAARYGRTAAERG